MQFKAPELIAQWVKKGIEVAYVFCTNGDQGGEESGFTKEEMPAIRQREQRAAGAAIGVTDITFLNYVDGHLVATIELRKDIVRQIRISKPDRIVCQSPERNWDRIGASHPDHLAAGEATIQAVYPDSRNPFALTLLKLSAIFYYAIAFIIAPVLKNRRRCAIGCTLRFCKLRVIHLNHTFA